MKKSAYMIGAALLAASSAWATIVTNDFNQANTAWSGDGSLIGADWNFDTSGGNWKILDNRVHVQNTVGDKALYNDALSTTSGGGDSFTVSLDVTVPSPHRAWDGIAFNAQDSSNFYYMRIRGDDSNNVQIGSIGNSTLWLNTNAGSNIFAADTDYTMTVSSDTTGVFDCQITRTSDGFMMFSRDDVTATAGALTGGYAGIYQGSAGSGAGQTKGTYDNFSVEVIPEPATFGLLGLAGAAALFVRRNFRG